MDTGVEIFSGDSEHYHQFRVQPPEVLIDLVVKLLEGNQPQTVVDMGCGTGLSTFIWEDCAERVIGVEPNEDMRSQANEEIARHSSRCCVIAGNHANIGVADQSVDVVACCQSLHWMNPDEAHPEILRVLRAGGLLVAYAYDMPPTIHPDIERAFVMSQDQARKINHERDLWPELKAWPMAEHLGLMQKDTGYLTTRQLYFHQRKNGTARDFVELAKSYGHIDRALKKGVADEELLLPELMDTTKGIFGVNAAEWIFGYRMIVGIKG